jgi:hypothetical protein
VLDVKVVGPVAYLSTLSATCRAVVDTLPDVWKLRLYDSPGEDISLALSNVREMAKHSSSTPPSSSALTELVPADHRQLLSRIVHNFREKFNHTHDDIFHKRLKEEVKWKDHKGIAPCGDARSGGNFLAFFESQAKTV